MEALSQDPDRKTLKFEAGQRQAEGTPADVGNPNPCILCGASSLYNYHKPSNCNSNIQWTLNWSTWRSNCGQSLCKLLSLSGSAARRVMANGPYCLQCSSLLWDINFTMTQLMTLEQRLRNLRVSVEGKIKLHSEVAKLIAKESKRVSSSGNRRNQISPDLGTEPNLKNFIATKLNEEDGLNQSTSFTVQIKQELDWCPEIEDICTITSNQPEEFDGGEPLVPGTVQKGKCGRRRKGPVFGQTKNKRRKLLQSAHAKSEDQQKSPPKNKVGRPRKKPLDPEFVLGQRADKRTLKEPKTCPVCSVACPNKTAYSLHVEREHPNHVYRCPACSGQYKREHILEWHIKQEHGGRERLLPFYCPLCRQGFETQQGLTEHEKIHKSSTNPFVCSICKLELTNSLDLERHVRSHERSFKCTHTGCEKTFRSEASLKSHVAQHTRPFICETCGRSFPFRCALTAHLQRNHPVGDPLVCHVCARTCKNAHDLCQHLRSHTDPEVAKRYPCRVCGQEFLKQYARKSHEERVHSGTKNYECPICGKMFFTSANLNNHKYKVHDPDPVSRERKRIRKRLEMQKYFQRRYAREMGLEQAPDHNSS